MPSKEYKEARVCECGYTTIGISNWAQHRKRCLLIPNDKDARIATLEKHLADTKEHLADTKGTPGRYKRTIGSKGPSNRAVDKETKDCEHH